MIFIKALYKIGLSLLLLIRIKERGRTMNGYRGSLAFVGCLFIGTGIGMLFDKLTVGSTIGLGVGFLAMAVFNKK